MSSNLKRSYKEIMTFYYTFRSSNNTYYLVLEMYIGSLSIPPEIIYIYIWGAQGDLDFRISDLVKNPDGTDINVCGEFR